jgi:tripartite-type tricarboxylate transporter receptor subunit TctC
MLAPAHTPSNIIERMRELMVKGLNEASVRSVLEEQGLVYDLSDGETFGRLIKSEITRWGIVVKANHIGH